MTFLKNFGKVTKALLNLSTFLKFIKTGQKNQKNLLLLVNKPLVGKVTEFLKAQTLTNYCLPYTKKIFPTIKNFGL